MSAFDVNLSRVPGSAAYPPRLGGELHTGVFVGGTSEDGQSLGTTGKLYGMGD